MPFPKVEIYNLPSRWERFIEFMKGDNMKKEMNWNIWLRKLGIHALIVLIAGLVAVHGESHWYLTIAPALEQLLNYLKHK